MQVMFINNSGGGYADYVEVREGTTISQFFDKQMPGQNPADILIRVNRQPTPKDYVLQNGDRVTMTPTKIDGAHVVVE